MSSAVPSIEVSVVIAIRAPLTSSTASPFTLPVRIFGPERSWRRAIGRRSRAAISRTALTTARCSSCVPCEKLRRKTLTPASISCSSFSGLREAGPTVATIFVRRMGPEYRCSGRILAPGRSRVGIDGRRPASMRGSRSGRNVRPFRSPSVGVSLFLVSFFLSLFLLLPSRAMSPLFVAFTRPNTSRAARGSGHGAAYWCAVGDGLLVAAASFLSWRASPLQTTPRGMRCRAPRAPRGCCFGRGRCP